MSTPTPRCPSCGADNQIESRFCSSCGAAFPDATQAMPSADEPTRYIPSVPAPTERIPTIGDESRRNTALIVTGLVVLALIIGGLVIASRSGGDGTTDVAGDITEATPVTDQASPEAGGVTTAAPAGPTAPPATQAPTASPSEASPDPLQGVTLYDDCIGYNATNLTVTGGGNLWQLTDGGSILTAHETENDAEKMHAIARRHQRQCFIGRDNSRPNRAEYIVQHFDGDSGLASGSFSEDCIGYDDDDLFIENLGASGWRLRAGNVALLLADNESDAKKMWKLADDNDELCFVGRGTSRVHEYWND